MLLKNVVIGCSIESILYAFLNDYYHIRNENFFPTFFSDLPMKILGQSSESAAFNKVKTMLSLRALNIEFEKVDQISLREGKIATTSDLGLVEYSFENCYVFDLTNVKHQNEISLPKEEKYKVYDDFTISGSSRNESVQIIQSDDTDFVREIHLYNSRRIDGSQYPTDAITVSSLNREDLYKFEYSDTMANFKLMHDLREASVHLGKVRSKHLKRLVFFEDRNEYLDSASVKFLSPDLQEVLSGKFV